MSNMSDIKNKITKINRIPINKERNMPIVGPVISIDLGWLTPQDIERVVDIVYINSSSNLLAFQGAHDRLAHRIAKYEALNNPIYNEMLDRWRVDLAQYQELITAWTARKAASEALLIAYDLSVG